MPRRGRIGGSGIETQQLGALSDSKSTDSSSREVAEAVKAKVLQHLQSSNTPQNMYEVVSYASLVVQGTFYLLKIKINTNPPAFIHVKVWQKLDGSKEFSGVETGFSEDAPILDF